MDRVIGRIESGDGPLLIVVGGVHGSEPAGVRASERLLGKLEAGGLALKGTLLCLRGNIHALKKGVRYIGRDLNRMWDRATVEGVMRESHAPGFAVEFEEMRGLASAIHTAMEQASGEVFLFDMHSTSSETIPFFWLLPSGDRKLITHFGLPTVHDPQMTVSGTMAQYYAEQGARVLLAEGGQHNDPATVDHCEAMLWITLARTGLLDAQEAAEPLQYSQDLLQKVSAEAGGNFNIVYHHKIKTEDEFVMRPGYASFQPVDEGELLAKDARGEVRAPCAGRILMPLYKPPCDDGFLIVQEAVAG